MSISKIVLRLVKGMMNLIFSAIGREQVGFDIVSLGLPTRSIDSPFFFELFAIPSTEFAV